jgi:hypothetical protein
MKITYNIDEEIDRIKTGDTVLICGLYGKNFKFINNKFAKVNTVVLRNDGQQLLYIAEVELLNGGAKYSVNFDFIYKLNTQEIVDNPVQHFVTIENPLQYYIHKKSIRHTMNFHDELYQHMSICVDKFGKSHVLLFSGIN